MINIYSLIFMFRYNLNSIHEHTSCHPYYQAAIVHAPNLREPGYVRAWCSDGLASEAQLNTLNSNWLTVQNVLIVELLCRLIDKLEFQVSSCLTLPRTLKLLNINWWLKVFDAAGINYQLNFSSITIISLS